MTENLYMIGYCSEGADRDRSMSGDSTGLALKIGSTHRTVNEQYSIDDGTTWITESVDETPENTNNSIDKNDKKDTQFDPLIIPPNTAMVEISVHQETPTSPPEHTFSPTTIITTSSSVDTLHCESIGLSALSGPSSPSNLSSITLVGSTGSGSAPNDIGKETNGSREFKYPKAPTSPLPERKRKSNLPDSNKNGIHENEFETVKTINNDESNKNVKISESVTVSSKPKIVSAVTKSSLKDDGSRTTSPQVTPIKMSSNVLQPMSYLTMNRRPSVGTIGVPVAALSQHRRSLQLNSSNSDSFGFQKVKINKLSSSVLIRIQCEQDSFKKIS